jgi:hypothetical protein
MIEEKRNWKKMRENARKVRKKEGSGIEEKKRIWRSRAPQKSCSDTITRK